MSIKFDGFLHCLNMTDFRRGSLQGIFTLFKANYYLISGLPPLAFTPMYPHINLEGWFFKFTCLGLNDFQVITEIFLVSYFHGMTQIKM